MWFSYSWIVSEAEVVVKVEAEPAKVTASDSLHLGFTVPPSETQIEINIWGKPSFKKTNSWQIREFSALIYLPLQHCITDWCQDLKSILPLSKDRVVKEDFGKACGVLHPIHSSWSSVQITQDILRKKTSVALCLQRRQIAQDILPKIRLVTLCFVKTCSLPVKKPSS